MRLFLTILMFLIALPGFGCNPEPGPQHFPRIDLPPRIKSGYFAVYNKLNGLISNDIRSILFFETDENSFTIVGTLNKGLMIFDGKNWHYSGSELFTFPELTVSTMAQKKENEFLAGTPAGVFKAIFQNGKLKFSPVKIQHDKVRNILAISPNPEKSDELLLGSDLTAGILKNESFLPFGFADNKSPTGFSSIIHSKSGRFVGCNGGLYKIDGLQLFHYTSSEETEAPGWVNSMASLRQKLFIAASNGVFILEKDGKLEHFFPGIWATSLDLSAYPDTHLEGTTPFVSNSSQQLIRVSEEYEKLAQQYNELQREYEEYTRQWAAQPQADLQAVSSMYAKFNKFQTQLNNFNAKSATLVSPLIKGLWIGTQQNGAILFAQDGQRYHLTRENSKLPSNQISVIASRDDGETWFGTGGGGLMHYTKRMSSSRKKLQKLLDCSPTRIRVIGDLILIGTKNDGMHIFNNSTLEYLGHFNSKSTKDFHDTVTDFAMDQNGNLWITGNKGVITWNGKKWRKIPFADTDNKPVVPATRITIDSQNRVYVAFAKKTQVYNQIFLYDGNKLCGTDPGTIKKVLKIKDQKHQNKSIELHGLSQVYMRNFDFGNATASLAAFEDGDAEKVSSLLNTEHYLLIGLENGYQKIFDGENFKQLSEKGTGRIKAIRNLFQLPSGIILIQGAEGICEFDSQDYKLIESAATGPGFEITDICPDQMNPETYRISYKDSSGGGYALYQEGFWEKSSMDFPVLSIAQADRNIFLATTDAVYYQPE
jgi:hypothetical protein